MKMIFLYFYAVIFSVVTFASENSFNEIVRNLDKPYAVTILKKYQIKCVWTRGDHGYLQNENSALEGTGVCWDIKALHEAEKLDKEGLLTWNYPASSSLVEFFTDINNACFYGFMGNATKDWDTYLVKKYAVLTSKYAGHSDPIKKLGESFDFGKEIARSPNDCLENTKIIFIKK